MNRFLFLGLIRDKSRSLFPLLIVIAGVFITVLVYGWVKGALSDIVDTNSRFYTGHLKVMTRAYEEQADQMPNDLALLNTDSLIQSLEKHYPDTRWTPRIQFGGLLDIPDEQGETRAQGPVSGMAIDLLNNESREAERLNLRESIIQGRMPQAPDEILVSEKFARTLNVNMGETGTLLSSSMYGSMAMYNFTIVGTVEFGVPAMDRGAMIADVEGIRNALHMENATSELLGYFENEVYRDERAMEIAHTFNTQRASSDDEFAPVMLTLKEQNDLASMLEMSDNISSVIVVIFVIVMSIVLWNAGLMGSLRRYGEFGVRLAIGESKGHIYRSQIMESLMVGFVGSVIGTLLGLGVTYYLQVHGLDISGMMDSSSIIMSNTIRARVTTTTLYIGFIPGFLATILGTMISGLGIYKRETSKLFKELEV
ncbi:MAG: FtsX-like permease family protein [Candidatus Marinimicrobia bacterium]|nr:FtsX-like permease family protein [Candidatus Neomarinimicrobiota bacterium]